MLAESDNPRHWPCHLLRRGGVPNVLWFEDAIGAYGVPTVVFDLYILVPDIQIAANVLQQNGWELISQQCGRIGNATLDLTLHPQLRLTLSNGDGVRDKSVSRLPALAQSETPLPGGYKPPAIVLLPAAEWNYSFDKNARSIVFLPSLEDLVDALIDSILDGSDSELQDHLNVQLAYLYGYAPELQERAFAERLLYEHRQYHFDIRSGMSYGTRPFITHQRDVRKALREGTFILKECSAPRSDESLFNQGVQARLLASLPPVCDEDAEAVEETVV